eukprot:7439397-Pyramimonas_sp.AAC.2
MIFSVSEPASPAAGAAAAAADPGDAGDTFFGQSDRTSRHMERSSNTSSTFAWSCLLTVLTSQPGSSTSAWSVECALPLT